MARPIRATTLSGQTSSGAGSEVQTRGHNSIGLHVVAKNLDSSNDTLDVQLEVKIAGEWAPVRDDGGTKIMTLSASDFSDPEGDGNDSAFLFTHGLPAGFVRARVTSFSDNSGTDLEVDAYVTCANWNGAAHKPRTVS